MDINEPSSDQLINQLVDGHEEVNEAFSLFYENNFNECHRVLAAKADRSLVHAVGLGYKTIAMAIFTNEKVNFLL